MQLVTAVAGAAIGCMAGGPAGCAAGAKWGWMIGSAVGAVLFAPSGSDVEGPRVKDEALSASTLGRVIPKILGTHPVGGNVIWAGPLVEHKHKEDSGGGGSGGGGGSTVTTYTYTRSFAVAFCEGEGGVIKLWANGNKLMYDASDSTFVSKYGDNITIYTGTETQNPDPTMEALEGVGNVPGHRGLVYIVFNDLPLEDYGNRIPTLTALISQGQTFTDVHTFTGVCSSITDGTSQWRLADDGLTAWQLHGTTVTSFNVLNKQTRCLSANTPKGHGWGHYTDMDDDGDGNVSIYSIGEGSLKGFFYTVNGKTGGASARLDDTSVGFGYYNCCVAGSGIASRFYWAHDAGVSVWRGTYISSDDAIPLPAEVSGARGGWVCTGPDHEFNVWHLSFHESTSIHVTGLSYLLSGYHDTATFTHVSSNVSVEGGSPFVPSDIAGFYNEYTNSLVILQRDNLLVQFSLDTETFTEHTPGPYDTNFIMDRTACALYKKTGCGRYMWLRNSSDTAFVKFDLVANEQAEVVTAASLGLATGFTAVWYVSANNSLVAFYGSGDPQMAALDRLTADTAITVQTAVDDICDISGLLPAERDTSQLNSDVLNGYLMDRRAEARRYLEPLSIGYFFGARESDDIVEFHKLGSASVVSIPESDLIEVSGNLLSENITQEVELPNRMDLGYTDSETEFQPGVATFKRYDTATFTREHTTVEFPVAVTSAQAGDIVAKLGLMAWTERKSYSLKLSWEYIYLDPLDVIEVTADGNLYTLRILDITVDDDMTLDVKAVSDRDTIYNYSGAGQTSLGFDPAVLTLTGPVVYRLLDIPTLRYEDHSAPHMFVAATGYYESWRGASFQRSTDGIIYIDDEVVLNEATMGWAYALPDANPNLWDRTNTLRINLDTPGVSLSDSTEALVIASRYTNLALVGSEVIQFVNATQIDEATWDIDTLLRGRFGTEWATSGHAISDRFVMLSETGLDRFELQVSDIGQTRYWRGVSFSDTTQVDKDIVCNAVNLKPWSPVYPAGSRDGSNNLTVTWTKRSRLFGSPLHTPPLVENGEAYEVDILDSPGGTVLRTITGLTSPTASYTAADQTNDGLTPGDPVDVEIYQISDIVGRGYALAAEV